MRACMLSSPAPVENAPLQLMDVSHPGAGSQRSWSGSALVGCAEPTCTWWNGELPPCVTPVIPGHQVVGVIERRGREASLYAPGARVGVARSTTPTCSCRDMGD
jgi:propanol-preferring alcohol dehydrogenase